jgi:hypothetical protein
MCFYKQSRSKSESESGSGSESGSESEIIAKAGSDKKKINNNFGSTTLAPAAFRFRMNGGTVFLVVH